MNSDRGCNSNSLNVELENDQAGPLKKTAYPWQTKGEGRNGLLRNGLARGPHQPTCANNNNDDQRHDAVDGSGGVRDGDTASSDDDVHASSAAVLLEIDGNADSSCLRRQHPIIDSDDCQSLRTVLDRPVRSPDATQRTGPTEPLPVAGVEAAADVSISRPHPALRRWQSKQLAQGIIDNAINKVLGDLSFPPFQNDPHSLTDGDHVWGSYLSPLNIESEGVAEAIRQQGLQQRRYLQRSPGPAHLDDVDVTAVGRHHKKLRVTETECVDASDGSSRVLPDLPLDPLCLVDGHIVDSPTSEKGDTDSYCPGLSTDAPDKPDSKSMVALECVADSIMMPPEELLNTAVSCAISHKGLQIMPKHE